MKDGFMRLTTPISSRVVGRLWLGVFALVCLSVIHAAEALPAKLLEELKDKDFKTREAAQSALLDWALKHRNGTADLLYAQYRHAENPEQRERCFEVLRHLVDEEYHTQGSGFIGIKMLDAVRVRPPGENEDRAAVSISEVLEGMAADQAGLKAGDLVLGMDDAPFKGGSATADLRERVMNLKPGTRVKLQVMRQDKLMDIVVTLGRRPAWSGTPSLENDPAKAAEVEKKARDEYFRLWLMRRALQE